jgi:hypothetical protein
MSVGVCPANTKAPDTAETPDPITGTWPLRLRLPALGVMVTPPVTDTDGASPAKANEPTKGVSAKLVSAVAGAVIREIDRPGNGSRRPTG